MGWPDRAAAATRSRCGCTPRTRPPTTSRRAAVLTPFDIPLEDGIRVDAGFETGSEVSTHYDAMLAKVIATRRPASRPPASWPACCRAPGSTAWSTNRDLLVAVLRDERFLAGEVSHRPAPAGRAPRPSRPARAARPRPLRSRWPSGPRAHAPCSSGIPVAWRNVVSQPQVTRVRGRTRRSSGGAAATATSLDGRDGRSRQARPRWRSSPTACGRRTPSRSSATRSTSTGPAGTSALRRTPRFVDPADAVASGSLLAPMPGTVVSVAVEPGSRSRPGQPVLVLEAMKMQHTVRAPGRRHGHRDRREARRAGRRRGGAGSGRAAEEADDERSVQRDRGAPGAAQGGGEAGRQVRPRVVHREGALGWEDHRAVAGDRQERLPRHQHPRGVRRRWRRHRRHRRGLRGARRAGLPAAADGRQPGDLRHHHQPLRHRGAEAALAARASATAPARWRSRSPSPTPAPTPTTSPPPPAATATSGCSTAARSTSPASTRPTTCSSSPGPRTRRPAR